MYNLQFIKNKNKFIFGKNKSEKTMLIDFKNKNKNKISSYIHKFNKGKILLDFKNYDYLFAFGSVRCNCHSIYNGKKNVKNEKPGFTFQISWIS